MNRLFIILILSSLICCDHKKPHTWAVQEINTLAAKTGNENMSDNLENYFYQYRLKPAIEINNIEGTQTDIQLANHRIRWINNEDETKIKIDNDLFTLKDKETLNLIWDHKDSLGFVNNWDEIKLFKHRYKEYIGIRMSFEPCNGLGCSVKYFLMYDVTTKSKNFFGTFRTDDNLELFDFNNDDKVDYVSKTFSGDAHGATPMEFIYELYSMNTKGQFKEQTDNSGKTYQIKHSFFPNDSTKKDEFRAHWITKIK